MIFTVDALTDPKNVSKYTFRPKHRCNDSGKYYPPEKPNNLQPQELIHLKSDEDWFDIVQKSKARFIFLKLPTGFGKSFSIGNLERRGRIIYCSQRPDMPTTVTLQHNYERFPIRHNATEDSQELLPDDTPMQILRHEEMENPTGNCSYSHLHREFMAKKVGTSVCSLCPLSKTCSNGEGEGYGFLYRVKSMMKYSGRFRAHINSISALRNTDTLIIDEVKDSAPVIESILIPWKDTAALIGYADQANHKNKLYARINKYWKDLQRISRAKDYGMSHQEVIGKTKAIFGQQLPKEFKDVAQMEDIYIESVIKSRMRNKKTEIPTRWVNLWYEAVTTGKVRVTTSQLGLTLTTLNQELRDKVHDAGQVIFMDATLTLKELCEYYAIDPSEVLMLTADAKISNVQVEIFPPKYEVTNKLTKEQVAHQRAVQNYYRKQGYGIITWKAYARKADLTLLSSSRGSNRFEDMKRVIMMGLPLPYYGAAVEEMQLINPEANSDDIASYYRQLCNSQIVQAIGRLRAHRRQSERLYFFIAANLDPDSLPEFNCVVREHDLLDVPEVYNEGIQREAS